MILAHVRKREMDHLVNEHPVVDQLRRCDVTPHTHSYECAGLAPCLADRGPAERGPAKRRASLHVITSDGLNTDTQFLYRETTVVVGNDVSRAPNPLQERRGAGCEFSVGNLHLHRDALDCQVARRDVVSGARRSEHRRE